MGYRNDCEVHHHRKPNRTVQKVTTPATFYVTNGQETRLAFPCWYNEILPPMHFRHHCRDLHDHIGWPDPQHVDRSCQEWDFAKHEPHHGCRDSSHRHAPSSAHVCKSGAMHHYHHCSDRLDLGRMHPIHLLKEGYEKITVQTSDVKSGLAAKGWIDESEDWVVRVWFKADIADLKKPFVTDLAIRANNDELKKIDTIFLGRLVVLPAAMSELPTT